MLDFVRPMKAGEEAEVAALLEAAFGGPDEARLVERLRKTGAIAGEMVLPAGGALAGYYALSYMAAPKGWLCLAPVAVTPERQGSGLGRRMMGQLAAWAEATHAEIVVLGRADLYEGVGFSRAKAAQFETPYPVEHTMYFGPKPNAGAVKLSYHKAFQGV